MKDSLFLSRIWTNPKPVRGYTEPYVVHQLVAELFGEQDARPYVYRVLDGEPAGRVLVLSSVAPSAEPVDRVFGTVSRVESKPFAPDLRSGQRLDYEIRVNATRSVNRRRTDLWDAIRESDPNTEITPHRAYGDFLARTLDAAARVVDARVTERSAVRPRRGDQPGAPMMFIATNVVGSLEVRQPDELLTRMASGLGRAKAFGCGLLCLSRPGTLLLRRHGMEFA